MVENMYKRLMHLLPVILSGIFFISFPVMAQDTLTVNLTQFIERGLQASGQVSYESRSVDLAQNRVSMAQAQRILPRIDFSSQHGVIPGVVSTDPRNLSPSQFYLDPNLENDWEDWAIFTRAELNAIQPIYSWGAIQSAINAARSGARAAEFQFDAVKAEAELQLYELYYSYLLALEISRILDEADREINRVERELYRMREEGDPDLKESDIFKFEIFKSEFQVQRVEVREGMNFVNRIWNYALQAGPNQVFMPYESFLDPIPFQLQEFEYYQHLALNARPELKGVESGIDALRSSLDAVKAQQYPTLFLGITGSYANTPNRPRQSNPFIINNTNYASGGVGFGIRQNLNFSGLRNSVDRAEIEYRRVGDLHKAVTDGITLEINERYREAVIAEVRVRQTEEALVTARNWVRNEQLNYDIGFGDVEDLLDSVQKELELRLQLKQNIFDLNKRVAALYKAGGIPIQQLSLN